MTVQAHAAPVALGAARRALARDRSLLPVLTVLVLVFYWLIHATALNPASYIDPWIYTASFRNFDFMFQFFRGTYYVARLPWVIPGLAVNSIFPPVAAFYVLHTLFFVAGAWFMFFTLRRFVGRLAAYAAFVAMAASPLYYNAHSTDYPDGAIIAYMAAALFFGLTSLDARRPLLRAGLSGFFSGAAVATNPFAALFLAAFALIYAALRWSRGGSTRRALAAVAVSYAGGAFLLILFCGAFSLANGGRFLFFMPQIDFARRSSGAEYKAPYTWIESEPRLLVPIALVVTVALFSAAARRWLRREERVFLLASGASLALLYAALIVNELVLGNVALQTSYYFSLLVPGMVLCLGSAVRAVVAMGRANAGATVAAAAAAVAAIVVAHELPRGVGRHGQSWAGVVAVAVGLLLSATWIVFPRVRRWPAAAAVVIGGLVLATNVPGATSYTTYWHFFTTADVRRENRDTLELGVQLMRFLDARGLQKQIPYFWYDAGASPYLSGIQSLYLWGITQVAVDLPRVDSAFEQRLGALQPKELVLLCATPGCGGAVAHLERAGIRPRPAARTRLREGEGTVWVRAYTLPPPTQRELERGYYAPAASPLSPAGVPNPLRRWDFTGGAMPDGWAKSSSAAQLTAADGGVRVVTDQVPSQFQLNSSELDLAPGTYTATVDGRVDAGGLGLSVLLVGKAKFLGTSLFWYGQRGFDARRMSARFTLTEQTKVEIVLWNWRQQPASSRWLIRSAALVKGR